MEEEKHFPGKEEPETTPPAPEPEEQPKEPEKEPVADSEPKEPKEPEKEPEEPKEPEPSTKKRSIYDDYKDEKRNRKAAEAEIESLKTRNTELETLLKAKADAKTQEEKSEADADIKAFAEKEGLRPEAVTELIAITAKRLPKPESNEELSQAVKDFRAWEQRQKRADEDAEIMKAKPFVVKELAIHDEAEAEAVMQEVLKLAHTEQFHDKEVEYIIWKNKAVLSKLVSPKKSSFEHSGQRPNPEGGNDEIDFSKGGVTPEQMTQEVASSGRTAGYEIRRRK